jgi:integrase
MAKPLTDRTLKALEKRPANPGKTYDVRDGVVPGLYARVMPSGTRTFVLVARYPGSSNPTRRALGSYGELTLEQAREKARDWLALIKRGVDPRIQEENERRATIRQQENTFAAVAEAFIAEKLPSERSGVEAARDIRKQFLPVWGEWPVTAVSDLDIIAVIKAKRRTAPVQARNLLALAKRLFAWAVDQRCYGLKTSPASDLKPTRIIGEKIPANRILGDDEMFALWRAAGRMPYPHGPIYRLLILTALRLNEVADASWSEFDLPNLRWIIPSSRMKGKNSKARPHAVPLTDEILDVLHKLPHFGKGNFLFSFTGEAPAWMSDKVKRRIDKRMLRTLRAMARQRGDDPAKVSLPAWKNHDIRRTVRSGLSRLRLPEEAREAVLAHARPGIKGTYDWHDYFDEKREALEMWAARLRSIVEPAPANVVRLAVQG